MDNEQIAYEAEIERLAEIAERERNYELMQQAVEDAREHYQFIHG